MGLWSCFKHWWLPSLLVCGCSLEVQLMLFYNKVYRFIYFFTFWVPQGWSWCIKERVHMPMPKQCRWINSSVRWTVPITREASCKRPCLFNKYSVSMWLSITCIVKVPSIQRGTFLISSAIWLIRVGDVWCSEFRQMFFNFKNKMDSTLLYMTINQKQLNWILQDKTIDVSFFEGEGHWQRGVKGLTLLRKTSISRLWARHYSLIKIYRERYTPLGGIKGKAKQPAKWCVKEGRWLSFRRRTVWPSWFQPPQ